MSPERLARLALFALSLGLLVPSPVAALEIEQPRPQLCLHADAVVIAEVTSFDTIWLDGDEGALQTRVWFAALVTVRGEPGVDAVELRLPGGSKDGVEHYVEDTPPKPKLDRRYLLFLRRAPDGSYRVIGGERGMVAIRDSRNADGERHIEALASVASCKD